MSALTTRTATQDYDLILTISQQRHDHIEGELLKLVVPLCARTQDYVLPSQVPTRFPRIQRVRGRKINLSFEDFCRWVYQNTRDQINVKTGQREKPRLSPSLLDSLAEPSKDLKESGVSC